MVCSRLGKIALLVLSTRQKSAAIRSTYFSWGLQHQQLEFCCLAPGGGRKFAICLLSTHPAFQRAKAVVCMGPCPIITFAIMMGNGASGKSSGRHRRLTFVSNHFLGSHFFQFSAYSSTFSLVTGIRSPFTKVEGGFLFSATLS